MVSLSGVDSSGKSTQVELLAAGLRWRGHKVITVWHRPGYSERLDRLRSAIRRIRPGLLPTAANADARSAAFSRPAVRKAWLLASLLDTFYEYAIKARWLLARGNTVVFDRYLEDSMLDLAIKFPEQDTARTTASRWMRSLAPLPDISFLLTLPWETMIRRSEIKQEPFPDPPETRKQRFEAYEEMARTGRFEVIDASGRTEEIHAEILTCIRAARWR